ncbi:unnamed protein product, partial [Rotaria socialis]
ENHYQVAIYIYSDQKSKIEYIRLKEIFKEIRKFQEYLKLSIEKLGEGVY